MLLITDLSIYYNEIQHFYNFVRKCYNYICMFQVRQNVFYIFIPIFIEILVQTEYQETEDALIKFGLLDHIATNIRALKSESMGPPAEESRQPGRKRKLLTQTSDATSKASTPKIHRSSSSKSRIPDCDQNIVQPPRNPEYVVSRQQITRLHCDCVLQIGTSN